MTILIKKILKKYKRTGLTEKARIKSAPVSRFYPTKLRQLQLNANRKRYYACCVYPTKLRQLQRGSITLFHLLCCVYPTKLRQLQQ